MTIQQPGYTEAAPQPYAAPRTCSNATLSLVLGLISLIVLGPFLGVPAMILSRSARKEIEASNGWVVGLGAARAGFWTGLVGSVWALGLVLIVFFFGHAMGLGSA